MAKASILKLPRPCGRREIRRQDRREAIIAVATRSFLEQGYAGTTMSAIAAALGGSKGTLWSYFPSKEALFEAVIDHATTAFRARLSKILDPSGDLVSTLKRFCTDLVGKITSADSVALHRLVVAEAERFPEVGEIFYNRGPRMTWELLGGFLKSAMDRDLLYRADPIDAARMLISLCLSGCHQRLLVGLITSASPAMIEADVDRALNMFMRAFAIP
jgi:AcrR family transcriptional regulator